MKSEATGTAKGSGDSPVSVFVLGPRGKDGSPDHPFVTRVYLDGDARLRDHAFLLFFGEGSAYALLEGPGGRLFHTDDVPLVDALVGKLQALYDLHPI